MQNKKYYEGIRRAIKLMHSRGKKAKVIDIGTGTGLLAMMAASSGADTVHACEVSYQKKKGKKEKKLFLKGEKDASR